MSKIFQNNICSWCKIFIKNKSTWPKKPLKDLKSYLSCRWFLGRETKWSKSYLRPDRGCAWIMLDQQQKKNTFEMIVADFTVIKVTFITIFSSSLISVTHMIKDSSGRCWRRGRHSSSPLLYMFNTLLEKKETVLHRHIGGLNDLSTLKIRGLSIWQFHSSQSFCKKKKKK